MDSDNLTPNQRRLPELRAKRMAAAALPDNPDFDWTLPGIELTSPQLREMAKKEIARRMTTLPQAWREEVRLRVWEELQRAHPDLGRPKPVAGPGKVEARAALEKLLEERAARRKQKQEEEQAVCGTSAPWTFNIGDEPTPHLRELYRRSFLSDGKTPLSAEDRAELQAENERYERLRETWEADAYEQTESQFDWGCYMNICLTRYLQQMGTGVGHAIYGRTTGLTVSSLETLKALFEASDRERAETRKKRRPPQQPNEPQENED